MSVTPSDATFRYNAEDPTDTQQTRASFQQQLIERWEKVSEQVPEYFDDEINYDRLHLNFRTWFENTAYGTVLQQSAESDVNNGRHWTASYVRDAYQQGLRLGKSDLEEIDTPARTRRQATRYFAGFHQKRIVREYGRAYTGLQDLIGVVVSEVGTKLREGVIAQKDRDWFIESVQERIEKTGINRAKAHANTVTVETVNEALLTSFEHAGVEQVGALPEADASPGSAVVTNAEARINAFPDPDDPRDPDEVQFVTAGDHIVCEQCRALEGTVVDIGEAQESEGSLTGADPRDVIPVHPNCRCRWVPMPPS